MAFGAKNKEIFQIEWALNCTAEQAIIMLSDSVENIFRPWFMSKTNIKGIVYKYKFLILPNTLYSKNIVLTGKITSNGDKSYLSVKARMLLPLRLFPLNQLTNWIVGIIMVISWVSLIVSEILDTTILENFFMPIFIITGLYMLLQFIKYLEKPELVDFIKRFHKIFENYIINS